MQFIRFIQLDPNYGKCGLKSEIIVQLGQIVKIEPRWTQTAENGDKALMYVGQDDDTDACLPDTHREYIVHDSLGNTYSSDTATEEGKRIISELWKSAK